MTRSLKHLPVTDPPAGLRDRRRANGSIRLWWEPSGAAKELGFVSVELDANKLTWSVNQAKELARDVAKSIEAGRRIQHGGTNRTMADLIAAYKTHRTYKNLKDTTKPGYNSLMNVIEEKWGSWRVIEFSKPVVATWYEASREARGKRQAQALVRMLSILFGHAEILGWRPEQSNPAKGLRMEGGNKGTRIATWDELDTLVQAARDEGLPQIGLGVLLAALAGQRQKQIYEARIGDFDRYLIEEPDDDAPRHVWAWRVDRTKRDTLGLVALHDEIVPLLLDAMKGRAADPDALLIRGEHGQDLTPWQFRDRFKKVRKRAAKVMPGVADLEFLALRRTFGPLSRIGGSSKDDAADVLGNTADQNAALQDIYLQANLTTTLRAVEAIRRPVKKPHSDNRKRA